MSFHSYIHLISTYFDIIFAFQNFFETNLDKIEHLRLEEYISKDIFGFEITYLWLNT